MDVEKLLGLNVRDLRRQQQLSQEELAHRADMDRSYISDLERGLRNPSVKAIGRIAQALGVPPDALLRGREG
jgi:transcriptional regulator with XRE-family HTH domain